MLSCNQLPNKSMGSLVLMWLLYAHNPLFSASDKRWTSSILNQIRLMRKSYKLCQSLNSISGLPWVMLILPHWGKTTLKCQISSGRISVDWNKLRSNCKRWFCSQLNILRNFWNLGCNLPRESYSMVLQGVEKLSWPKQLQMNAVLISFQSRVHNY